jgi:hypothetical protein
MMDLRWAGPLAPKFGGTELQINLGVKVPQNWGI